MLDVLFRLDTSGNTTNTWKFACVPANHEKNCKLNGWCKTQVMQVNAGQQNAGQSVWVKTSGMSPRLTAVHAKHEKGRSTDDACCNVHLLRINPINQSMDVKDCIGFFH